MNTIISFLKSPRFLSFLGHAGAIGAIAIINDITSNIGVLNLSTFWVTIIGLVAAQIVGAIKNLVNGQPAGFSANKVR